MHTHTRAQTQIKQGNTGMAKINCNKKREFEMQAEEEWVVVR